jgi:phosphopantetheinyl transferase
LAPNAISFLLTALYIVFGASRNARVNILTQRHAMLVQRVVEAAKRLHLGLVQAGSPAAGRAIQRWSTEEDRENGRRPASLLCRALLRGMLAEITQTAGGEWRFSSLPSGAPVAIRQGGEDAPTISMSHSGSWVAYAATFDGDVGIDIELVKPSRNYLGIAEHAFGPSERAAVSRFGPARFYAIWTLREAIAKATAAGLEKAADGRDQVHDGPYNSATWATLEGRNWWLMHAKRPSEMSLSVALRPREKKLLSEIELLWWPPEE